ncbi:hypothetical protein Tco_0888608 [Tanacetum coccineum]
MQKQDTMIQTSKCINSRENTNAGDGKISKDASEIDNNVGRDFHDKDNITELQEVLENRFRFEKQNIEKVKKQKDELQDQFLKEESEFLNAKNEIDYVKKAFKQKEEKYLNDIIQLEAKNKDLENTCVKLDVHDTEEILNDAEESQVKMKEKPFPFNYENINSLYDISEESDVPPKEMSNKSKFQKLFVNLGNEIKKLVTFNIDLKMDKHRTDLYEDRKWIERFFSHEVFPISYSLNECSTVIKQEITKEVHEMLDIFESMERKVDRTSKKNEILQNKIDQLLEANIANDVRNIVMQSYVKIKNKEEIEQFSKESKDGDKFCNDVVEVNEKLLALILYKSNKNVIGLISRN